MALKLVANYSKRLGLPEFSSHQFSVSIEAEINNVKDVAEESARLYEILQHSVDEQIRHAGFVATKGYGGNGQSNGSNGHHRKNGHANGSSFNGRWECTDRQQDLIRKLIDDNQLNKADIEKYSVEAFAGKGVSQLDKGEASQMIEYLIGLTSPPARGSRPRASTYRE